MRRLGIKVTVCAVVVGVLARGRATWADFTFGTPTNLGWTDDVVGPSLNLNCSHDYLPCLSADGLELYFQA